MSIGQRMFNVLCFSVLTVLAVVPSTVAQENGLFWWLQNNPQFGDPLDTTPKATRDSGAINSNNFDSDDLLVIPPPPKERQSTIQPVTTTTVVTTRVTTPAGPASSGVETKYRPEEDEDCVCVEYYLCDANNTVITNGDGGLIDVRLDKSCPGVQVCCRLPPSFTSRPSVNDSTRLASVTAPPVTQRPVTAPPVTAPPITQSPVTPNVGQPNNPVSCGIRGGGFASRILAYDSDNSTQFAEFPWMLALLRKEQRQDGTMEHNRFQCGASLIHPQVAITAAHCVTKWKPEDLKIRAGEWDTQGNTEPVVHQESPVARVIRHRDFYSGALYNDIALLILEKPLKLVVNVQPICLPNQGSVFNSKRCVATGWGLDAFGKTGKFQTTLKKIELPMVPSDVCQAKLRESRLGHYFRLHQSFVCAGGEPGRDTCEGDGGSPLACYDSTINAFVQVGIVSWGIGCGEKGVPAVYTNVPLFRKWIDETLFQLGLK